MKHTLPTVVIVGRTNVGKSTLFNRLSSTTKSITLDQEGVTRDFLADVVSWAGRSFTLIDTGGIVIGRTSDPIMEQIRQKAFEHMNQAELLLMVVDGVAGMVQEDRQIINALRKTGKKIFLVVNKIDRKDAVANLYEFQELGFELFPIAAQHNKGIGDLLDAIIALLPATAVDAPESLEQQEPRTCKVVLLGKPNVGKSSLMNLLVKQERSIVHDEPGTTREAISENISFYQAEIQITDTAGVRRKRGVSETLEMMMVKTSFRAVQDADIVLLMIDSAQGQLADQELKLAFYVLEQKKALILLFNKQDLVTELSKEDLKHSLEVYESFLLDRVPAVEISCKTGKNIGKIIPLVAKVWERYSQMLDYDALNQLLKEALARKPLFHKKSYLILYKAKQIKTAPITILLTVNESNWFGESQLKFFENVLRDTYDLYGVPVSFVVRKRSAARK